MDEKIIRLEKIPLTIPGFCVLDDNGDYNIFINCGHSFEKNRETLLHELKHIEKEHFFSTDDIKKIEKK
jgi:Zn-dependent peptidase ImmA (M78 family)